jgi:hypothetical protein
LRHPDILAVARPPLAHRRCGSPTLEPGPTRPAPAP